MVLLMFIFFIKRIENGKIYLFMTCLLAYLIEKIKNSKLVNYFILLRSLIVKWFYFRPLYLIHSYTYLLCRNQLHHILLLCL